MSVLFDRWRLMGVALCVSMLLVLAAALSGCGSGATVSAGGTPASDGAAAQTQGKPAPQFSGVTLDGKNVTLDQYRGKPLLLVYMTST